MPANKPLLKKTRMPPKAPAYPKNPVVKNYRYRPRARLRCAAICNGGPWHGRQLMAPLEPTMVFTIGPSRGRYKPTGGTVQRPGKHHQMRCANYEWEDVPCV